MTYFDHNATSPLSAAARAEWLRATEEFVGNPSSPHRLGHRAEVALEGARERLAAFIGAAPPDVVWTSGATESINMALHHHARRGGEAWTSALEHPCVHEAARLWFGYRVRVIPALACGVVDLEWLVGEVRAGGRPDLIAIMAANNETGALQPWREALELCEAEGIPLLCDAAQWMGKLPGSGLGSCSMVAGCGHKFGGPQGVGFLTARGGVAPLLVGGGQEEGRRAGTENVAGVLAMVAALEDRERASTAGWREERGLWRDEFVERLQRSLPGLELVAEKTERLWNTVSLVMPECGNPQRPVVRLDKAGFAVSTGSACASGKEKPSHVLSAMGCSPALAARVLRFSSGWETTRENWMELAEKIEEGWGETGRNEMGQV